MTTLTPLYVFAEEKREELETARRSQLLRDAEARSAALWEHTLKQRDAKLSDALSGASPPTTTDALYGAPKWEDEESGEAEAAPPPRAALAAVKPPAGSATAAATDDELSYEDAAALEAIREGLGSLEKRVARAQKAALEASFAAVERRMLQSIDAQREQCLAELRSSAARAQAESEAATTEVSAPRR